MKQKLDELVLDAEFAPDLDEEAGPAEQAAVEEAIRSFLNAGPELLDAATPFLWAYYQSFPESLTRDEREEYGIPEISPSADIWDEVVIDSAPSVGPWCEPTRTGPVLPLVRRQVSWEPEHGLRLVFEEGRRLCKVSPYGDHFTTAHAYGDETLLGVVFK